MRNTYVLIFLLCFSCNNSQDSFDDQSFVESNSLNDSLMNNDVYPQQDQIKPTEVGNKFCPDTKELDFFQKNGIVKKTGGNNVIGEFKNDSIYVKILLKNCVIKYRAIESMLNCSKSLAKYHNGNLVFYDSTDRDCNIIIHFDIGLENHNSTKVLPKYLQGNSRDKIE